MDRTSHRRTLIYWLTVLREEDLQLVIVNVEIDDGSVSLKSF